MTYKSIFRPCSYYRRHKKPYRIRLLFTQKKNGDLSAINVTKQSCAAPIPKVERHLSDRFCASLWCGMNRFRTLAEVNNKSFRFWDEEDYEYEIFSMLSSARAWASVILAGKCSSLLRVLARMSYWREQVIKCKKFYHFAIGRGLNVLLFN